MKGHYDGVINEGRQSGVNIWVLPRARGPARAQARAIKQESPSKGDLIMYLYLCNGTSPSGSLNSFQKEGQEDGQNEGQEDGQNKGQS